MLKNVLSLLLSRFYSKQESELVGHQAMPSTNNVILTPTTTVIDGWSSVFNGVAPTDGFACIRFTADTATCIASAQTLNINVFTTPQVVGDILLCACPVAKGQVFTLCARQAKNIECWFTKTIGGGGQSLKNALLQGGGLCLKTWYSSLRRSSCRVRDRGFNTQSARVLMQWPLVLQPTASGTNSHPAWTGMSRTVETPQSLFWKFPAAVLGSLTPKHLREGTSSLYREVKSLVTSFQQIQQCRFYTLSPCEEKTNFAVGGVSC